MEFVEFEILDSRWNGNEALRYDTDKGPFFVKLNRVEDPSVYISEVRRLGEKLILRVDLKAVGLSAILKTESIKAPYPLHVGKLPKVGELGPGSFMILEWMQLLPFGAMRPENQKKLAENLAALHSSTVHQDLHQGRFGFPVSNFLALTPLNNEWEDSWTTFFSKRVQSQVERLYQVRLEDNHSSLSKGRTKLTVGRRSIAKTKSLGC